MDASWQDPELDDAAIAWARSTWDAIAPYATGGVYINFAGLGDDANLRAAALGANEVGSKRSAVPTTPAAFGAAATGHEPRASPVPAAGTVAHRQRSRLPQYVPGASRSDHKPTSTMTSAACSPTLIDSGRPPPPAPVPIRPPTAASANERAACRGGMALLAITSVGLWTLRVALTARGRRTIGATVAAVEAVIFAVAFTNVAAHLDSPIRIAAAAAGVAFGTVLGLTADRRLSQGSRSRHRRTRIRHRHRRPAAPPRMANHDPRSTRPQRTGQRDLRRRRRLPADRTHNSCTSGSPRCLLDRPTPRHRTTPALPDGYLQIASQSTGLTD